MAYIRCVDIEEEEEIGKEKADAKASPARHLSE
jgi:hypothetical protein